ncbi:hypothetical protein [Erythrobacter crassostreae]|uniref:Uncharacterized protein n=1 Tax=Erythrobacter crassostreae TaxID=2828328 RepID=A0A9X1JK95_9SPHN|nr:hypothetical protein [Erythrobacter crassostrea]MBV7258716.1 hypothetical protein [Erythrobacter crassostrea]
MLGKIIGAAVGGSVAKQSKSIGGTTGAVIGAAVPFVLSRMSLPAMVALGVGGYVAKKYFGKSEETLPKPTNNKTGSVASVPQPATA